ATCILFLTGIWVTQLLTHIVYNGYEIFFYKAIKKPYNSKLEVSLIMNNLLPYTQKIEPQGKMLKQLVIFLKNYVLKMLPMK
ncbi:hypothetical protein Godav_025762, partial [Gossypium davidsonii]|nr:hypothetical protein [Gossypium davidsonii]